MAIPKKIVAKPLPPRIHIDEFLQGNRDLSVMERAGFRVTVKKEWMRKEDWVKELVLYLDR